MRVWLALAVAWGFGMFGVWLLCRAAARGDRPAARPVCSKCLGLGKVRHPSYGADDYVTCDRCGGAGWVA